MVPFPGRKRKNPNVPRSPLSPAAGHVVFHHQVSPPPVGKIIQTSPQRRAFSKLLQMLNTANQSRCTCDKENQRLAPKLLKLLKLAKKEKNQLQENLELAMQKARRDIVSANKYWGEMMENLNREHATSLRKYEDMMVATATECQKLRVRNEELVNEVVSAEKQLINLQAEKTDELRKLKSVTPTPESKVLKLLQEQSDERNAMLQYERQQSGQLRASHEAQLQIFKEENAQVMESVSQRLRHAIEILKEAQEEKDPLTSRTNLHRLGQELDGIANMIETPPSATSKSRASTPIPSLAKSASDDVFEDCVMDAGDDDQPLMVNCSSESRSCESSPTGPRKDRTLSTTASINTDDVYDIDHYRQSIIQLEESLEGAVNIQKALEGEVENLKGQVASASKELALHVTNEKNNQIRFSQQLESSKHKLESEQQANHQLQEDNELLRREVENLASTITRETAEHQKRHEELTDHLKKMTNELSIAEKETKKLQNALKQLEDDHAVTVESMTIECEDARDQLRSSLADRDRIMTDLQEQLVGCNQKLSVAETTISELNSTHENVMSQLEHQLASTSRELSDAKQTIAGLTNEVIHLGQRMEVEALRADLDKSKVNARHEQELVVLRSQLAEAVSELNAMKVLLKQQEEEYSITLLRLDEAAQENAKSIREENIRYREEASTLKAELVHAKEEVSNLRVQMREMESKHVTVIQNLEEARDDARGRHMQQTEQIAEMASRHADKIMELETERARTVEEKDVEVFSLQQRCDNLEQEKKRLETVLATQVLSIQAASATEATIQVQLVQATEEIANLRMQLRDMGLKHVAAIQNLEDARDEARGRHKQQEEQIVAMESRHADKIMELEAERGRSLEAKDAELYNLQRVCGNLDEEKKRLEDELATQVLSIKAARAADAASQAQLVHAMEEIANLKGHIRDIESKNVAVIQNLENAIDEARGRHTQQEEQIIAEMESRHAEKLVELETEHAHAVHEKDAGLYALQRVCDNLEQEKKRLEDELATQVLSIKAARAAEAVIQAQLVHATEEIANLRVQLREMGLKHVAAMQNLEDAIDEAQGRHKQQEEQIVAMESRHAEKLLELETEHVRIVEEKDAELYTLEQLCDNLDEEKKRLEDELATQISSIEAVSEAEVNVLKQYTQQLEDTIDDTRKALYKAQTREYELIDQIDRLQGQVQSLSSSATTRNLAGDGKENNERSFLFSPGVDPSREGEILELRRGLFAADTFQESDTGDIRRRPDDSSILDRTAPAPYTNTSGAQIVPFSSPEESLIHFDESFQLQDWQERCFFLENDREDLIRVTDSIIEDERITSQWQVEAAVATAKRKAVEQQLEQQLYTRQQMTSLYGALCPKCRHNIDSA